jgi:hypothetical protein
LSGANRARSWPFGIFEPRQKPDTGDCESLFALKNDADESYGGIQRPEIVRAVLVLIIIFLCSEITQRVKIECYWR